VIWVIHETDVNLHEALAKRDADRDTYASVTTRNLHEALTKRDADRDTYASVTTRMVCFTKKICGHCLVAVWCLLACVRSNVVCMVAIMLV
jgi:hypothetical protein